MAFYTCSLPAFWWNLVKAVKSHLKHVLSNTPLTFEKFYTVLTQVEAVLNSRPLVPLTTDPNDLEATTASHFIIGESLNALPVQNLLKTSLFHLTRFQHLQKMTQHFWCRWKRDYLHTLNQRGKWPVRRDPGQLTGKVVLLHEDNLLPA